MFRALRRLTTTAAPRALRDARPVTQPNIGQTLTKSLLAPPLGGVRDYRTARDPRIAFAVYKSRDGAPDSAIYTAAGARALQARIDPDVAAKLRISIHDQGTDIPESARDPQMGPEGVKNFANVQ